MAQVEIPPEAVAQIQIIRISDEDLAKVPVETHAEMWQAEVDSAKAMLTRKCQRAGREIEKFIVTQQFRHFGIIEGYDFRGIEGIVEARLKDRRRH